MLRFSRSYCIYFVLVSVLCTPGDADPSISTSTPTPCYGDVVTLVCHHPEVANNPGRYFSTVPSWRENGVGITPSTGVYHQADTSEDFTNTTLTITITVDHFRNKSFNYSCLLVLAGENGLPSGSQTSENVTVDPIEPRPPSSIENIDCRVPTSIAFNWTHTPVECYKDRISYYVSWVNINNNTENGSDVTGGHMYNNTGLVANSNYTISVRTVVDGNVWSTAVSRYVTTSKPLVLPKTPSLSACYNRNFTLYCDVSPLHIHRGVYWIFNSRRILGGFDTVSSNGKELVIHNVTASTAGDYGCSIELNSGTLVEGDTYSMHPLGTYEKEERNSPIPSYVNVELDDGTVPMTTSPGYMQVERMTEGPKPLYGNL